MTLASTAGTRIRAGNAMDRTRVALLDGARRSVAERGIKITMGQVAASAGVAKATLYNHFRTRDAVLHALLLDEIDRLVEASAGLPLPEALHRVAAQVAQHPLVRTLAQLQPGTVTVLGRIDVTAQGWRRARSAVEAALAADGRGGVDFVMRWLASYLVTPAEPDEIEAGLSVLLAGLPARERSQTDRGWQDGHQ